MAIEFSNDSLTLEGFVNGEKISTVSIRTEEAVIRQTEPETVRQRALRADRTWISKMYLLTQMMAEGNFGMLALSDGVTSHCVNLVGVRCGSDDYLITYHDPSPVERGSFLEKGKNVAGCAAIRVEESPGFWTITAEDLFCVLDSAILAERKSEKDVQTDNPPGHAT